MQRCGPLFDTVQYESTRLAISLPCGLQYYWFREVPW